MHKIKLPDHIKPPDHKIAFIYSWNLPIQLFYEFIEEVSKEVKSTELIHPHNPNTVPFHFVVDLYPVEAPEFEEKMVEWLRARGYNK